MKKLDIIRIIKENWMFFLIFLLAFSVRIIDFNSIPEEGHLKFGYNFYGNVVKNFVDYGFIETKFGMVMNGFDGLESSRFVYYTHHPSNLFFVLVALIASIFGISPWVLKILPFLLSMGSLILIYLIGKMFFGKKISLIASFLFVLVPLAVQYASHLDVKGPQVLFFILLTSFFYFLWVEKNAKKFYWLMIISFFIGSFSASWTIYLLFPGIFAHNILKEKRIKKEMFLFGFIVLISLCLFLFHVKILTGSFIGYQGSLIRAYQLRSSNIACDEDYSMRFTSREFLIHNFNRLYRGYTPLVFLLFIIWVIILFVKIYKENNLFNESIILTLLAPQMLYLILFKQSMWIHEFLWTPSIAGILLASSVIIDKIKFDKNNFLGFIIKLSLLAIFVYFSLKYLGIHF